MICVDVSCVQNDYSFLLCSLDLPLATAHKQQTPDFSHSFSSNIRKNAQISIKLYKCVDVVVYTFSSCQSACLSTLNYCLLSF